MQVQDNSILFEKLRQKHPEFVYENYFINYKGNDLYVEYLFTMAGNIEFRPTFYIPAVKYFRPEDIPEPTLRNLIFHIGMVELISYWKTACPPNVVIKPHKLNESQIEWWKNMYYKGMGEFFFMNNIKVDYEDFLNISNHKNGNDKLSLSDMSLSDGIIIPVGGGKDSVVTLELLKNQGVYTLPMVVNHRHATRQTIECAGYDLSNVIEVKRKLDEKMLELNSKGYLNGHTPFSALLAFISLLTAIGAKTKNIALSNESSANESTIPGTEINHQYSKSYAFEKDFKDYVANYICHEIDYFSFLRPLNELQIAGLFAGYEEYHKVFKSCNAGSKSDIWCCRCPKCLFVFIIISPFLDPERMIDVFGENLFGNNELKKYFDELTGISEFKPFECVGTVDEVNIALCMTIKKYYYDTEKPALLKYYMETSKYKDYCDYEHNLLNTFSVNHFVPESFLRILEREVRGEL